MYVRCSMGVSHSFSIKNIFYDKMNLKVSYFRVTNYVPITLRFKKLCCVPLTDFLMISYYNQKPRTLIV